MGIMERISKLSSELALLLTILTLFGRDLARIALRETICAETGAEIAKKMAINIKMAICLIFDLYIVIGRMRRKVA